MTMQPQTQATPPAETETALTPEKADKEELLTQAGMITRREDFKMALEPSNLEQLIHIAGFVAKTGICGCTTIEQVIVRTLFGRSLGLSMMQSLRAVYDIDGKPALDASVMQALCIVSPACEEFRCIHTDAEKASYSVKRRGQPAEIVTFTLEEAADADLLDRGDTAAAKKKNNWNRWRRAMLRARAKSNAARQVFPEILMGMYSGEELRDAVDRDDEMIGEVVPNDPPTIAAAARDFEREMKELAADIAKMATPADGRALRARAEAWDAPTSFKEKVTAIYNARVVEMKNAAGKGETKKAPETPKPPPSDPDAREAAEAEKHFNAKEAAGTLPFG